MPLFNQDFNKSHREVTSRSLYNSFVFIYLTSITKSFLEKKKKRQKASYKPTIQLVSHLSGSISPVFKGLVTCRTVVQNKFVSGKVRHRGLVIIVIKRHDESAGRFTVKCSLPFHSDGFVPLVNVNWKFKFLYTWIDFTSIFSDMINSLATSPSWRDSFVWGRNALWFFSILRNFAATFIKDFKQKEQIWTAKLKE